VVRGEGKAHVVVVLVQVLEVPGAVADVDVRVAQVGDDELGAARAERDALGRVGQELHEPDRPRLGLGVRVEPALDVDDRGDEGRIEVVVPAVRAEDLLVLEWVARPQVPVGLCLDHPRPDRGHGQDEEGCQGQDPHESAPGGGPPSQVSMRRLSTRRLVRASPPRSG
jgi:hypothetical protein